MYAIPCFSRVAGSAEAFESRVFPGLFLAASITVRQDMKLAAARCIAVTWDIVKFGGKYAE